MQNNVTQAKSTLDKIQNIRNNGFALNFSDVFNHAFENYKKIALYAGLILLVFGIILGIAVLGVAVDIYGAESISKDFIVNLGNQAIIQLESIVSIIIFTIFGALAAPFGAGFLKMADCADKDQTFNVSTIFTYYKTPYFAQIFIATFIIAIVGSIINILLKYFGIQLISALITLLVSFFTYLVIPLLIFGNLKALAAIKSSCIIISRQIPVILGLIVIAGLFSTIGIFVCCIGIIFTMPFSYSMTYALYHAILGIDEKEDSIDSIGQSDLE